ncbi:uncharacterized protein LOC119635417 [Glossina fuscipes]|uniref:Uncharacterized protein LOC119635417 n=1 Tax=Glossina fuscipes TaxID=7396 RepID=A0A8U0WMS5_9MUSC|nr:uncharacterized protein LOC119635417 [Glossina fuscipes]
MSHENLITNKLIAAYNIGKFRFNSKLILIATFLYFTTFILVAPKTQSELTTKTWTMEPLNVEWNITDDELVKVDVKLQRINRTIVAFDGTIELLYELDEYTMMESAIYRSATGSINSYQRLPYRLPRNKVYDILDQYKDEISKNLRNCSNFPLLETHSRDYKFRELYRFDRCTYSTDILPNYLLEGYYKAIVELTGETNWSLTFLVRIEPI